MLVQNKAPIGATSKRHRYGRCILTLYNNKKCRGQGSIWLSRLPGFQIEKHSRSPYPLYLGGGISPPKFWGRPSPKNTVKQGASDTPPPKFRGWICHPHNLGGMGLQGAQQKPKRWSDESYAFQIKDSQKSPDVQDPNRGTSQPCALRMEPPRTRVRRPSGPEIPKKSQTGLPRLPGPDCKKKRRKSPKGPGEESQKVSKSVFGDFFDSLLTLWAGRSGICLAILQWKTVGFLVKIQWLPFPCNQKKHEKSSKFWGKLGAFLVQISGWKQKLQRLFLPPSLTLGLGSMISWHLDPWCYLKAFVSLKTLLHQAPEKGT